MDKAIWVLMTPDNDHWSEDDAREEIERLAKVWEIKVTETGETRDTGFGQEVKFIIEGDEENIHEFLFNLDEALY